MINYKKPITILISFLLVIATSCTTSKENPVDSDSIIYFGGDILTMESDSPVYVESIVIESGEIAFTGSLDEAEEKFPGATKKDLNGKTLMPGFIDALAMLMSNALERGLGAFG